MRNVRSEAKDFLNGRAKAHGYADGNMTVAPNWAAESGQDYYYKDLFFYFYNNGESFALEREQVTDLMEALHTWLMDHISGVDPMTLEQYDE